MKQNCLPIRRLFTISQSKLLASGNFNVRSKQNSPQMRFVPSASGLGMYGVASLTSNGSRAVVFGVSAVFAAIVLLIHIIALAGGETTSSQDIERLNWA
jgi:hypothetical protein